jgi:hypothetical protein
MKYSLAYDSERQLARQLHTDSSIDKGLTPLMMIIVINSLGLRRYHSFNLSIDMI